MKKQFNFLVISKILHETKKLLEFLTKIKSKENSF